jgi:Zn-dependent protease
LQNITKNKLFYTSKLELKELIKAWIVISIAFAFARVGLNINVSFFTTFLISALTVGIGFLAHEFSHKIVAQHYGCKAEFKANNQMLILSVILAALAGIVFAAPGAVFITGPVGTKRNGIISLAGPLSNIILATLFVPLTFLPNPVIQMIGLFGFNINLWLALFNMIPLANFDGAKIYRFSKIIFYIMVAIPLILLYIPYLF